MKTYIKRWPGPAGKRFNLILEMLENLKLEFDKYHTASLKLDPDDTVPPFWYGERQTNGFVTMALSQVPAFRGRVMQEFPHERKMREAPKNMGWVDYICSDEFGTHCALELKQSFISYDPARKDRIGYFNVKANHDTALKQLASVELPQNNWINWSAAISVAPVALKGEQSGKTLGDNDMKYIANGLGDKLYPKGNRKEKQAIAGYRLPKELGEHVVEWTVDKKNRRESYPAVFFVTSIRTHRA